MFPNVLDTPEAILAFVQQHAPFVHWRLGKRSECTVVWSRPIGMVTTFNWLTGYSKKNWGFVEYVERTKRNRWVVCEDGELGYE